MELVEDRLRKLGITLPRPPKAIANYLPGVRVGELLFVAGTVGTTVNDADEDTLPIRGKLGRDLTIEEGYQSARYAAINHLAMISAVIGSLNKVLRIVRMIGYVNAVPGFTQAPWVLNGASDLFVEVFGPEAGRHARAALYQHDLTLDSPIEIETIVHVQSE